MDFLRNILVNIYGDAPRNRELPGSVRKISSRSQATDAGIIFRIYGSTGFRNLWRQSSVGALWRWSWSRLLFLAVLALNESLCWPWLGAEECMEAR